MQNHMLVQHVLTLTCAVAAARAACSATALPASAASVVCSLRVMSDGQAVA